MTEELSRTSALASRHTAGWLEGGLTMGYEKFVMDLDQSGAMLRMVAGLPVADEDFGRCAYAQAGPGENFLSTDHTMRHFETANYEPGVPEAGPFETWDEQGRLSAQERARGRWKEMLAQYEPPEMDGAVVRELDAYVDTRKSEMTDAWH